MNDNTNVILLEDERAASIKTVTGWVSRLGHFYGAGPHAEHNARYDGSTHHKCDCGRIIDNRDGYCRHCHDIRYIEKYNKMERKEWNGTDVLYSQVADEYFFDKDSLMAYCEENEIQPDELRLIICEPTYPHLINPHDEYCNDLPEDGEVPDEILDIFEELNEALKESKVILSWYPGKFAAIV
jgi:hypothetical protein